MAPSTPEGRARAARVAMALGILGTATLLVLRIAPPPGEGGGSLRRAGRGDGPAPNVCHTHQHSDYMGDMAVVWGSNFIVADAAACCDACNAHALICGKPGSKDQKFFDGAPHPCGDNPEHACNMWVFCDGGGAATDNRCFSFDIHNHTRGECWLKRQEAPSQPKVGDSGAYPPEMRAAKREVWPWAVETRIWPWPMPEHVHWTSGVLLPEGAAGVVTPGEPVNFVRWCGKHGPCTGRDFSPELIAAVGV